MKVPLSCLIACYGLLCHVLFTEITFSTFVLIVSGLLRARCSIMLFAKCKIMLGIEGTPGSNNFLAWSRKAVILRT